MFKPTLKNIWETVWTSRNKKNKIMQQFHDLNRWVSLLKKINKIKVQD